MQSHLASSPTRRVPSVSSARRAAFAAGTWASVLSAVVLGVAGRRECGSAVAPLNAVSHWCWGDEALRARQHDLRHTLVGYAIHHAASVFWAGLLVAALQRRPEGRTPARVVSGCVATSGVACLVDFKLTPRRFTPGFEHRLSKRALGATYALFAVGLLLGLARIGYLHMPLRNQGDVGGSDF